MSYPKAKDLIGHLLCVDPAQRYTIDEFMNHPWSKMAPGPAPPPTPNNLHNMPLDSPLLAEVRGMPHEARSPGIASLKEAFDVTYAVHRMEEEGARRRAAKGGANRGFLGGLNEESEDSSFDEDEHVVAEARQRHAKDGRADGRAARVQQDVPTTGAGAKVAAKRAVQGNVHGRAAVPAHDARTIQKDRLPGSRKAGFTPFELDMGNATLLGRRHKRGGIGAQFGGSPLAQQNAFGNDTLAENPGSPMRVE